MSIKTLNPGAMTTVQDEGRFGYMDSGISESGAMDKNSYRKANYLVGNKKGEAALEITLIGPELFFDKDTVFGYMGAEMDATLDGEKILRGKSYLAKKGQTLKFGFAKNGIRAYLAFAGGVDVPIVLGSRSTNIKCEIGGYKGRKLQAGDTLETGDAGYSAHKIRRILKRKATPLKYSSEIQVRVIAGPQDDYFTENGIIDFFNTPYKVSTDIDRMGIRLDGKAIEANAPTDIVSDGITFGSIQVTSSGMPIILMADHQTTGGYAKMFKLPTINFLGAGIPGQTILTLIIGFVVMGVLTLFIKYTKLGKAMRAVPEDKIASTLVGINVNKIITTTFAIGAGLAAIASMMYTTSYVSIKNELGISLGLKAFVAAVLGGIGSIPGAMIGGLLLGIVEILVKVYMLPGTYEAVTYLILIFVLLVKPTGLLGKVISEKV